MAPAVAHPSGRVGPRRGADASLLFFNAEYFKGRVLALSENRDTPPRWFLFDAESVPILDVTGADALEALRTELSGRGIVLAIARAKGLFRVMLERTGVADRIGAQYLFPSVHAGVQRFLEAGQHRAREVAPQGRQRGAKDQETGAT